MDEEERNKKRAREKETRNEPGVLPSRLPALEKLSLAARPLGTSNPDDGFFSAGAVPARTRSANSGSWETAAFECLWAE